MNLVRPPVANLLPGGRRLLQKRAHATGGCQCPETFARWVGMASNQFKQLIDSYRDVLLLSSIRSERDVEFSVHFAKN
jgi:hypothetical protein